MFSQDDIERVKELIEKGRISRILNKELERSDAAKVVYVLCCTLYGFPSSFPIPDKHPSGRWPTDMMALMQANGLLK